MALRRIEPIAEYSRYMKPKNLGQRPVLRWVAPTDLYVDETYQRDLSRASLAQLRKIVTTFAWDKMKPPVVVDSDGLLHVIDGQHTAIAAATIGPPTITEIPVFIVGAQALHERARSFVAHNLDRVKVGPFAIYKALLAGQDPEALSMQATLDRAGVRLRPLNQLAVPEIGDCSAIGAVQSLLKVHGPMRARVVLECLKKAERAPISADEIKAVAQMLWVRQPRAEADQLAQVIHRLGSTELAAAQARAKLKRVPAWRELVERWSKWTDAQGKAA